MTGAGPIDRLPPVPWVRERDVDLLLAQLLSEDTRFVSWLVQRGHWLDQIDGNAPSPPSGTPTSVKAVVNFARPDAVAGAAGESDVIAVAQYEDGRLVLSIEDKVWATPQQNQGARHRAYVEQHQTWGVALIVGPKDWIDGHRDEVSEYHAAVSLENVARWCAQHGFDFQASVFLQACEPQDSVPAPDLNDWHLRVDGLLREQFGLRLSESQRYVRVATGNAKPNRWAQFAANTLQSIPGLAEPVMVLRPKSTRHDARVAIDIPKAPDDFIERTSAAALASGFATRCTKAHTLIIERHVAAAGRWVVSDPFERQVEFLQLLGRAALELQEWWNSHAAGCQSPSGGTVGS